jgi:hypothetical protein
MQNTAKDRNDKTFPTVDENYLKELLEYVIKEKNFVERRKNMEVEKKKKRERKINRYIKCIKKK